LSNPSLASGVGLIRRPKGGDRPTSSSEERIRKWQGLILEALKIARDRFLASEVEVVRKLRPFRRQEIGRMWAIKRA
jgi:hypothetical protein